MKFGGTSVADAERIKRAARRIVERAEEGGSAWSPCSPRAGSTPTSWSRWPRGLAAPAPARDGHAALHRRADLLRARGDGDQRPRSRGDLAHRLAGRDRHRHLSHQGAHHRGQGAPHPRGARRRQDRAGGRLPGRVARLARRDHARPRRLGHHRRRAGRRARRRGVRDLHRRRRRVQRRPADRARRAQAAGGHVRGDARDVGLRAPACCSCARSSTRATTASRIHCRSSFEDGPGTVVKDEEQTMERPLVTAVTHSTAEARITLTGLPDRPASPGAC